MKLHQFPLTENEDIVDKGLLYNSLWNKLCFNLLPEFLENAQGARHSEEI